MPKAKSTLNLLDGYAKPAKPRKLFKGFYFFVVHLFALAGLFFLGSFALSILHLTNVSGSVDADNKLFQNLLSQHLVLRGPASTTPPESLAGIQQSIEQLSAQKLAKMKIFCQINIINQAAGDNAKTILQVYKSGTPAGLVLKMIQAVRLRLNNDTNLVLPFESCDNLSPTDTTADFDSQSLPELNDQNIFPWTQDETWPALSNATKKDKDVILAVADLTNVEPRLIVAAMFAEQSRLFRTDRGLFKKYLASLQILAAETQFSLGVMGIKPQTAQEVEKNLTDPTSVMYLGPQYEHLLDFTTSDPDTERYRRLVDDKNHSFSYLYGALYLKQLEQQWQKAGFPIADRPEILGTLYNIGFAHSDPNPNPAVGGSVIPVNGTQYTYGSLVYEFYYSGELLDEFPFDQTNPGN